MRRLVVLCSAFAIAMLAPPMARLTPVAAQVLKRAEEKPPSARQKGKPAKDAAKKTEPDARPILRRADDLPALVTPSQPPAKKRARAVRKPTDAAPPASDAAAPTGGRAAPKDMLACGQVKLPDAAIDGCSRIIEDEKQKPKGRAAAYFNRGNAHTAKGDHAAAIADYDEAIKLDPRNASAYNNRGNAKNEKGDGAGALADFDAALKANARYAAAYFSRANAYAAKGEAGALKDYDAALRYDRRNVNAYIARGALLLASGATAKARADMRRAAALDRRNAYAVLWHEIAERRARQKGVLAKAKGLDRTAWPAPVLALFAGEKEANDVIAAADNPDATVKAAHVCEANFYSGEHALIGGNRDEAVKLFRAAVKDCPHGFLEGIAAAAELKGLEKAAN